MPLCSEAAVTPVLKLPIGNAEILKKKNPGSESQINQIIF